MLINYLFYIGRTQMAGRDLPPPTPGLPLHVILLTHPLVYTCHVKTKLHGMSFGAGGRLLFLPTPYIYTYSEPTPCCKFGGKSLAGYESELLVGQKYH